MGFYVRCRCTYCELRFRVDSGIEFYLSPEGVEKAVDETLPDPKREVFALRGYWDFKVCSKCFLEYRYSTYLDSNGNRVAPTQNQLQELKAQTCSTCEGQLLDSHRFLERFEDRIRSDFDEELRECRIKLASCEKIRESMATKLLEYGDISKIDLKGLLSEIDTLLKDKTLLRIGYSDIVHMPKGRVRIFFAGSQLADLVTSKDLPQLDTIFSNLEEDLQLRITKLEQDIASEKRFKKGITCPRCNSGELKYRWYIS